MSKHDHSYMSQALDLALKGRGQASPNPMVGAVLVRDGLVVGKGVHRYGQRKHAEVWALEQAGDRAREATLYVNLEPCCHQGRTGPCCQSIVNSGIARVVVAMEDPNPLVAGKGIEWLTSSGLEVTAGVREEEARRLNEAFTKYISCRKPFVTAKVGATLDGRIASGNGPPQWITGPESRQRVHQMRLEADAILVGISTVLQDNPYLTDRSGQPRTRPLLRVVLDSQLRFPLGSRLASTHSQDDIIIFCNRRSNPDRRRKLEQTGIEVIPTAGTDGRIAFDPVLEELGRRQVVGLLIEGGGKINFDALRSQVIDKLVCFLAPRILGGQAVAMFGGPGFPSLDQAPPLAFSRIERIGPDVMIEAYPNPSGPASGQLIEPGVECLPESSKTSVV